MTVCGHIADSQRNILKTRAFTYRKCGASWRLSLMDGYLAAQIG